MVSRFIILSRAGFVGVMLICFWVTGCEPESHQVDWQILFASDELRDRALFVEATIRQDGCPSGIVEYEEELSRGDDAPTPPALRPGRYGFKARARDAECLWFASGCADVNLPDDGSKILVTIVNFPVEPECDSTECVAGICGGSDDGGPGDADVLDADHADGDVQDADLSDTDIDEADADADESDPCGGGCSNCEDCVDGVCMTRENGEPCDEGYCYDGRCCTASVDDTAVTTIDETSGCFEQETDWFWDVTTGDAGHHFYTWTNDNAESGTIGTWVFAVETSGQYQVQAYVPGAGDSSRQAVYVIRGGLGQKLSNPINQSTAAGWTDLGTYEFTASKRRAVSLADNTGEARTLNRKLLFDALRLTFVPD